MNEHIDVDPENPDGQRPIDWHGLSRNPNGDTIRSTMGHPATETPLWVAQGRIAAERKKVDDTEGGTCD